MNVKRVPAYVFTAVFFLAGFLAVPARAQISFGVLNNGTNTYVIDVRNQGAFNVRLAAIPDATGVTTCSVQVDGSSDNVTFGSADVLASQSCLNRAAVISPLAAAKWIRLNITQSGTGNVQFNLNVDKGTAVSSQTTGPSGPSNGVVGQETTAVNNAITIQLALAGNRTRLYSFNARCSGGTAGVSVVDNGTTVWSSGPAEVGTTSFTRTFPNPIRATAINANLAVTLTSCGATNTGTLDVQLDANAP